MNKKFPALSAEPLHILKRKQSKVFFYSRLRRSGKGRKQRHAWKRQTRSTRKLKQMLQKGQKQKCVRNKLKGKHGQKRQRRSRKKPGRRRGRQESPRGSPTCDQIFLDGSWGSWVECKTSCGISGTQIRHRPAAIPMGITRQLS